MNPRRVVVAGAGLSGMACAFDLVRAGFDVTVLEAAPRAGGVVGTIACDGFRFEIGPNTVQGSAASFRRLCADLGIAERLIATPDAVNERYLFHRGRLLTLPSSPADLLTWSGLAATARLRLASEAVRRFDPSLYASEPDLQTFLVERIGHGATRILAGSIVRGIFAAELSELGVQSAFPKVWELAVEHGGLIRGLKASQGKPKPKLPGPDVAPMALLSFPDGFQELVDALVRALGARLHTNARVERLERRADGWRVHTAPTASAVATAPTSNGTTHDADEVVLAVPAPATATLLASTAADRLSLAHLHAIGHARLKLVHLGFAAHDVPGFPRGFGYLVPPSEDGPDANTPRVLGTIFVSNLFAGRAPRDSIAVSSFYKEADVASLSEHALVEEACRDLARALRLGSPPRPAISVVESWNDVLPKYSPGHAERMRELLRHVETTLPGLHLAGSYTGGIAVDQVIARGRAVAGEVARRTRSRDGEEA